MGSQRNTAFINEINQIENFNFATSNKDMIDYCLSQLELNVMHSETLFLIQKRSLLGIQHTLEKAQELNVQIPNTLLNKVLKNLEDLALLNSNLQQNKYCLNLFSEKMKLKIVKQELNSQPVPAIIPASQHSSNKKEKNSYIPIPELPTLWEKEDTQNVNMTALNQTNIQEDNQNNKRKFETSPPPSNKNSKLRIDKLSLFSENATESSSNNNTQNNTNSSSNRK